MSLPKPQPEAARISVAGDHPALAGHFPGAPILPGVLLLDEALYAARSLAGTAAPGCGARWCIRSAKFTHVVRPGETVIVSQEAQADGSVRFSVHGSDGTLVASGTIGPATEAEEGSP